jgi:IS30 family transposase
MQKFKQLNLAQRYQIEVLLIADHAQTDIANILKVHKSTISRELSRNIAARGRTAGKCMAENAQRKTTIRHKYKSKYIKFTDELKQEILPLLCHDKWSPELISEPRKEKGNLGLATKSFTNGYGKPGRVSTEVIQPILSFIKN